MKYFYIMLFLAMPVLGRGQNAVSGEDSTKIIDLITDLKTTWTLGIIGENTPIDMDLYNRFKELFDSTAVIDNEFNAVFELDSASSRTKNDAAYKYTLKRGVDFGEYAHDLIVDVFSLSVDSVTDQTAIMRSLKRIGDQFEFTIFRKVTAKKKRPYVLKLPAKTFFRNEKEFENNTLNHGIRISDSELDSVAQENRIYNDSAAVYEFKSAKNLIVTLKKNIDENEDSVFSIVSIRCADGTPDSINCFNDFDSDGILNPEDNDYLHLGDFTGSGQRDRDFDGVINNDDHCDKTFGMAWNKGCPATMFNDIWNVAAYTSLRWNAVPLRLPEPDKVGYRHVDMNESKKGNFSTPTMFSTISTMGGVELTRYINANKNVGFSLGFNFATFRAKYTVLDDIIYTYKDNDGVNDFRRLIRIHAGGTEDIQQNVLNWPVSVKMRTRVGHNDANKQRYVEASLGVSLMYFFNRSNYNMTVDYEGLYQIDSSTGKFTYYDYFDRNSTWNVWMTGAAIDSQATSPGMVAYFKDLRARGYSFYSNEKLQGEESAMQRLSLALNTSLDYYYKVNDQFILKIGLGAAMNLKKLYSPVLDYKPVQNNGTTFHSFFNSNANHPYMNVGINFGILYSF